ncbi:MAG: CoB--CoM heterodisulfide reductase iron-sulfur subunit A family protein [Candidatus Heimdallarchaeota archaeon]|nr:CoB--CoM heterodisulfide reductase iron-sulfur subunit A family protein [Candidatus Heimdallarchaeota archaeon]
MTEEIRIGVYTCHCGVNISSVIDIDEVVNYAKALDNVVLSRDNIFTCSAPGQNSIIEDIKEHGLNRVVVAACSPHMHERTFRNAAEQAGLNRYLVEIANIREQSAWVHPQNPIEATDKAKTLVRMAVAKARLLEAIEITKTDVKQKLLVIGGGVAGLKATQDAAQRGLDVTLVERSPTLGGHAARIGKLVHTNISGSATVNEFVDQISVMDNVTILTNAKVTEVKGSFGDYSVSINIKPRYVKGSIPNPEKGLEACPVLVDNEYEYGIDKRKAFFKPFTMAYPSSYVIDMNACTHNIDGCDKCVTACGESHIDLKMPDSSSSEQFGTIIVTTGFDPYEPKVGEYGYKENEKVITLMQLERYLSDDEIDFKRIGVEDPQNIVFISCVGSMNDENPECSRMCCSSSFKNMIRIRHVFPNANIFFLYQDIRTYARREELLYETASAKQVMMLRWDKESPPKVDVNGDMNVKIYDSLISEELLIPSDLIVLSNGMLPREGYKETAELLKLPCSSEGWIQEAHAKLRPVELPSPGVYVGGTAQAPRDIMESITTASAATAKALIPILQGQVEQEAQLCYVNEDVCGACGVCITTCPYEAITKIDLPDDRQVANVNAKLCHGCGQCAGACPTGAMQQKNYRDDQIYAMINALIVGGD